jgi:nucleoside-diphosphate-sugar epimerase
MNLLVRARRNVVDGTEHSLVTPASNSSFPVHLLLIGHGYLGQAITRQFRESGWHVTPVSLTGGHGATACDVSSLQAVRGLRAVAAPGVIIHCAASGHGGADAYQRVYVDGCRHLLEIFPGTPLLFTSSSSVYAQADGSVVTEVSPTLPDRDTAKLLLEAERLTLAGGGIIARLSGIYGPERSVILKKFLAGEAVIEDDGRRYLNQIHRDDAARAIHHLAVSAARNCGEVFNLSDSSPLGQLTCYRQLSAIFQRPLPPFAPRDLKRKRGWTHKQVSSAKLQATGWQPQFPSFLDAVAAIAPTLKP